MQYEFSEVSFYRLSSLCIDEARNGVIEVVGSNNTTKKQKAKQTFG